MAGTKINLKTNWKFMQKENQGEIVCFALRKGKTA